MFFKLILSPLLNAINNFGNGNAFCINEQFYSYNQLARHISKIRSALQLAVKNTNIGLVVNDDIETYASIFAIWLEGLTYVPIHPRQPHERNAEIIVQTEIDLIIDSSIKTEFTTGTIIKSSQLTFNGLNIEPKLISDDALAYILFTSGSTGIPKGVQITRRNIGSFMKAFWEIGFQIDKNDRCLQCFDLTFDVSVQSFLVPLTRGACTYTIPHSQIKYSYIYGLLDEHKITFGAMTPSMIRYLRPYFSEIRIPSMRYNILTAEASPLDLILDWSECIPNAEIYNFYGPTEATIYCTYKKFFPQGSNKNYNGMLSIGKPMNGLSAIIIDKVRKRLGKNQKGELCISGDQITLGYWGNYERNAKSFFDLTEGNAVKRFYKTGDLCYIDDDGDLLLIGRLDHQVKIQGYRVELGEIEYHARKFLVGQNVMAITFSKSNNSTEIALFIEGELSDNHKLLEYLKQRMPFYMIPAKILFIDKFPLNASGKNDRIALKKLIQ